MSFATFCARSWKRTASPRCWPSMGLRGSILPRAPAPRLVILDLRMPRLDGFTACAQISRLPGYIDVPIAILSAFDSLETREAAQRAGASAFLSRRFKPVDLLRMMAELLAEPTTAPAEIVALIWRRRQELPPLLVQLPNCRKDSGY